MAEVKVSDAVSFYMPYSASRNDHPAGALLYREDNVVDDKDYIELQEHRAIICLPENTVELTITAKVFENGELQTVSAKYGMSQVREMFEKADKGYIDDDDQFVITEKGLEWLEELNRERDDRP